MRHWLTRPDAPIVTTFVKRFDPLHWTIDFPRGSMASVVTAADGHGLHVEAEFLRRGDLVGLIFESEDRHAHPAHARETNRDYSGCTLEFEWQSSGLMPLDAVNGPTLTIEGRDGEGAPRSWFVRLWNYAQGSPTDATVRLDFDALDGGFNLPVDADRVDPRDIDRMFISLIPPDYAPNSPEVRSAPAAASVTVANIRCDGSSSVLAINDAVGPEHAMRIATAYDDMYHLPPERVVQAIERLGYRGLINHYIGMSHYFGLGEDGLLDPARTFNAPALAWHRDFARAAAERGYGVIWSLSYEILDMFCPAEWKQRTFAGAAAATGYDPPSTLLSPASVPAIAFLANVAASLAGVAQEAGLQPQVQIGEPWWWVTPNGAPCLYDDDARAALGGTPVEISDVRQQLSEPQKALLDSAGDLLAGSTGTIAGAVRSVAPEAAVLVLIYLPSVLAPDAPEVRRANLPLGWARPAFDAIQLEDYEWLTSGRDTLRAAALAQVDARLGYPRTEQHYFAGFAGEGSAGADWPKIVKAAAQARRRGVKDVIVWALPQVLRDGLTLFGEEHQVAPFEDVLFPIAIGQDASVSPGFSTSIVTSAGGYEVRNVNWQEGRLRFDAGPGVRSEAELEALIGFFRARRGASVGFRFRDPFDHSSKGMTGTPAATDQLLGEGDGERAEFALVKTYGGAEQRRITRPVAGSVRVAINGIELTTGWSLGEYGIVQFEDPPASGAQVTAGFLFDCPVRFESDRLEVNRATFLAGEAPSVPLVEIREDA